MHRKKVVELERRQYLRLDSVFPVELQVLDGLGKTALSGWLQGFTCNVSLGGLCLSFNNLEEKAVALLTQKSLLLALRIHIPLAKPPVKAVATLAWLSKVKGSGPSQYQLGIKYQAIDKQALKKIMHQARWLRFTARFAFGLTIILIAIFGAVFLHNLKLRLENKNLVEKLVKSAERQDSLKREMDNVKTIKEKLRQNLAAHKNKIRELEIKMEEAQAKLMKGSEQKGLLQQEAQLHLNEVKRLKEQISLAAQEQTSTQAKLSKVEEREGVVSQQLDLTNKEKSLLTEEAVQKMFKWLKSHQNNHTGLILSFEGDNNIKGWAFIYDQSLAAISFVLNGDFESAKKILNFFNRASPGKFSGFYNAYYASSGEVAEYTIHTGPNIWLGIAIMQYSAASQDPSYLPLAQEIAGWLITLQEQDPEAGLRGGPNVSWFSTEHNLDGFAFFNMLYEATGQKKYELASRKLLSWLVTHAYGGNTPPIKRGKGDSTIATDTYAWSLAALGPEVLKSINMDPAKIMDFAEENCGVTVDFRRPDKEIIKVKGFDFAKYSNMPRGGIVSSEWTAQMAISYLTLSDFFGKEKNVESQEFYRAKANAYLNELSKLVISSPSPTGQGEGCLPYATSVDADTGHGWRTPKGSTTGSVAGTCYTIFAEKKFNPLRIERKE